MRPCRRERSLGDRIRCRARQLLRRRETFLFCCIWLSVCLLPALGIAEYDPEGNAQLTLFKTACTRALKYQGEEGLASMLSAAAGIGAIVTAAIGGFRTAWALVVIAMGSFILSYYIDIWFGGACPGS